MHRHAGGALILELEPANVHVAGQLAAHALAPSGLATTLTSAVQRFSAASTLGTLADAVVQIFRELTGYDRAMVSRFDPDGHGNIIAEARHPRLDSLLGHHYPATNIPQRARSLHLQYLKNPGVTGTLGCSLVREGQLWGLVAAHHCEPRSLRLSMRAAADLLAEVARTRISAIENYAHAQGALMVRRLEQRLIEATPTESDWRRALFRNPRTLLQQLEASGGALVHEGDVLTSGEVPSTPELRALLGWVDAQAGDGPFARSAVG